MTTPRILLIEAAGPESTAIAAAAHDRGFEVYAVTQPDRWAGYDDHLRSTLTGHLLTDLSLPERALSHIQAYARRIGAAAVLTTNEYLTPLTATVCAELGLPGNDPSKARAARNKAKMIEMFLREGVRCPRTAVAHDPTGIDKHIVAAGLSYPLVVKPAESAGSSGVTVLTDATGLSAAFHRARNHLSMYGAQLDPRVLIQDYIPGTEYSVESMTQRGISTHVCVTRKKVTAGPNRIEVGHGLPVDANDDRTRAIVATAQQAIAAVGITNSASHTEVMLGDDGSCTVIEVAARIGAGNIGVLIQHALGIDPWTATLDIALGTPAQLTPTLNRYATVRFLTSPHAGRLAAVTNLPQLSAEVPLVRLRTSVGALVKAADDNSGRLGCFVVVGSDPAAIEQRADILRASIHIEVESSRDRLVDAR